MHISEGILSGPVLAAGVVLTVAGVAAGLRKMDAEDVPKVAVLSSAFFVASLIHLPVPPASVHLVLNGLAGIILGWTVFPALLVGLFLQAILFQFGGLTVLGVNTLNMALPAVVCYYLFNRSVRRVNNRAGIFALGFAAGALSVMLSGILLTLSLYSTGKEFLVVAVGIVLAHIPVMFIDGLVTGSAVVFLRHVRPELLEMRDS